MLKIKEGKEYGFFVEKEIQTPDGKNHFILKGPDQKRYLLRSDRYSAYNITINSEIICKVDKINCSGEVFLEPRNPWYKEGEAYNFHVIGHETRSGVTGTPIKVIIVTDRSGNHISVPVEDDSLLSPVNSEVQLLIERITKGKLILVKNAGRQTHNSLTTGREYEFVIEGEGKGVDDENYFILRDPYGNIHTIPKDYYDYYGFKTGTAFKGKIVKYKKNGERTIEPENPFYKTGSVIKMKVTGWTKNAVNDMFTVTVKDNFGFSHCIELATPPESGSIRCRLKMIKKGKPLFVPII